MNCNMVTRYITYKSAVEYLNVTDDQLSQLIGLGVLKKYQKNGELFFRREDITDTKAKLLNESKKEAEFTIHDYSVGDEISIAKEISEYLNISYLDLDDHHLPPPEVIQAVPLLIAQTYNIAPISLDGSGSVTIATSQPQNHNLIDTISFLIGFPLNVVIATPTKIRNAIKRFYNKTEPKILGVVSTPSGRCRIPESQDKRLLAQRLTVNIQEWYNENMLGPRVFIGMPFHEEFDPVSETIIAAVESFDGRALRIDQVPNLRNIWLAIEQEISRADIMIADFTGDRIKDIPNPNVVTEATIALHKYAKPVIVITQSTESLFFDWRHQLALVYHNTNAGLDVLYKKLVSRLSAEINEVNKKVVSDTL